MALDRKRRGKLQFRWDTLVGFKLKVFGQSNGQLHWMHVVVVKTRVDVVMDTLSLEVCVNNTSTSSLLRPPQSLHR